MGLLEASPDTPGDKLIAFDRDEGFDGNEDVYVIDLDGANERNITQHPARDLFPIFSPDGKRIAFLSNRSKPTAYKCFNLASDECVFELFLINPDGSGLAQLTTGSTVGAVWSPDSTQIAYLHFFPEPGSAPGYKRPYLSDIYIVNADGSNLRNITAALQPGEFALPAWSSDGQRLAFFSNVGIAIVNADGSGLVEYPLPDYHIRIVRELIWSPDNRYLYFQKSNGDLPGDDGIFRAGPDFAMIEKLDITDPLTLSPDGKWLAYLHYYFPVNTGEYCAQVRVLNTATLQDYFVYDLRDIETHTASSDRPLKSSGLGVGSLVWVSNSRQVLLTQWIRYGVIIYDSPVLVSISLDGTGFRLIGDLGISSPSLQP